MSLCHVADSVEFWFEQVLEDGVYHETKTRKLLRHCEVTAILVLYGLPRCGFSLPFTTVVDLLVGRLLKVDFCTKSRRPFRFRVYTDNQGWIFCDA